MVAEANAVTLNVVSELGNIRALPLYDSAKPLERKAVVYTVKTLPNVVRLALNQDYELIGSVQATPGEWEAALLHSLVPAPGH